MSKNDVLRIPDYLEHILEALKRIAEYVDSMNETSFMQNALVQDAVLRNIEILGEAAKNLVRYHSDFIKKYSDVPWEDMYWMRNRISHDYFSVDLEVVWKTLEYDLPGLEKQVRAIYQQIRL
jgi:uncharacterized protein with HEPN domain